MGRVVQDEGTLGFGVVGVEDADGDARLLGRGHGWRIEDLGAEFRHVAGGAVRQVGDGRGGRDDLRVGSHDAGHVGPDLHDAGVASGGIKGRRIVGAAAAQGHAPALQVGGDEAGGDEDIDVGVCFEGGADVGVAQLDVDLAVLGAYDLPGVDPEDLVSVGGELSGDDPGGEEFAEGLDGLRLSGRDGAGGVDAVRETVQLVEGRVTFADRVVAGGAFEEFLDDAAVDAAQGIDLGLVGTVALGGFGADLDEGVRTFADGGGDQDDFLLPGGGSDDLGHFADDGRGGDRGSAEFQYFHVSVRSI